MQVQTNWEADFQFGLIQRKYQDDPEKRAELELAYHAIVIELRSGNPSIWFMGSDRDPDGYTLEHPPLVAHFRKVHENKVAIFAFEEQH
jgi:hypothetical protein